MISFTIPGKPVPLARHRHGRNGSYLPKRSRDYRELVEGCWLAAGRPTLGDSPFTLSARFYGLRANADLDNAVKGLLDALNGLAFTDDRQLVCMSGVQRLPLDDRGARCELELWRADRVVAA